ncbi:MAG TPA: ABC transporter family substrate-binding protein [Gaiellaceae bacterium]|nr:ABC transporter family substrate-binding protein [Gaiellaceae bacterium]
MRSSSPGRRSIRLVPIAAVAAAVLILSACGGGSSNSSGAASGGGTTTSAVKSGGSLTFALDEDIAGFNVLNASQAEFVTAEILDQVWPSVFIVQPSLKPVLDTDIVTSAKLTKKSPQTVVYTINPKAKWSDGTPINADDFIYNWQSQSGSSKFTDLGGKPYEPASTSGYNQIQSVTGSNGGKTVTVVFSKPFGDWKALFSPMIPAHISKKVGFNGGWSTFNAAAKVSGGPYEIKSYAKGSDLVEVPNPTWWGAKPKLSKIIFRFILDDSQQAPAVQNGEVNMVNPALPGLDFYDSVNTIGGFKVSVQPGLEFQHIDFNEANPYLAKVQIRRAIAWGTDRATIAARTGGEISKGLGPLQNRLFMTTQPQFKDVSGVYGKFDPSRAKTTLQQAGMTMGSDGYFHPNFGPQKGKDFTLNISTTTGVPVRSDIEQLFKSEMKTIGVKINIKNYTADKLFGTIGPKGEFDLIEFAWVSTPFASGNQPIYCSYTNASVCGENWDHYADPQVDKLFDQALQSLSPEQATSMYNQIDALLWKDMATLPLFQQPQLYGWSTKYVNIVPNTSSIGIPWNANQWGVKAS